jgi:hypothetical protein
MFGKLKAMFGFTQPKLERPNPDPISAQITIATQRNADAAQKLNALISRDNDSMTRVVVDIVGKM